MRCFARNGRRFTGKANRYWPTIPGSALMPWTEGRGYCRHGTPGRKPDRVRPAGNWIPGGATNCSWRNWGTIPCAGPGSSAPSPCFSPGGFFRLPADLRGGNRFAGKGRRQRRLRLRPDLLPAGTGPNGGRAFRGGKGSAEPPGQGPPVCGPGTQGTPVHHPSDEGLGRFALQISTS